jgi:eukaryotic-like serine/threonine-protein kinase
MERSASTPSTHDPEVQSVIRLRLPRLGLFLTSLVLLLGSLRIFLTALAGGRLHADRRTLLGLAVVVSFFSLWLLGRSAARSLRFLRGLEAFAFLCGALGYGAILLLTPAAFRAELPLGLVLVMGLLVRGVYIPSTVRRSVVLSLLVGVPFLGAVVYKYLVQEPLPEIPGSEGISGGALAVAWSGTFWAVAAVVAAGTSQVTYGLQRQVSRLRQLGQYVLGEKLGEGGMGVVYRAHHALLRRPTAIKLLAPDKLGPNREERFEREVQLTARLSHPHTVTVFDYGRTPDGTFYYAMELLEGADLSKLVEVAGPLPPARVAKIMGDVAGALAEAHELGLVHRDIKAANIMICWRGGKPDVTKVLDFGLAKDIAAPDELNLTGTSVLTGTPLYMAPEMVTAPESVSAASDLYALGCVGYFLLCGEPVFVAATAVEVAAHHVRTPPVPISQRSKYPVPAALERLIMACLEKDPRRRPASAGQLESALMPLGAGWTDEEAHRFWSECGQRLRPAGCCQPSHRPGPVDIDMDDQGRRGARQDPRGPGDQAPERNLARVSLEISRDSLEARRSSTTTP